MSLDRAVGQKMIVLFLSLSHLTLPYQSKGAL